MQQSRFVHDATESLCSRCNEAALFTMQQSRFVHDATESMQWTNTWGLVFSAKVAYNPSIVFSELLMYPSSWPKPNLYSHPNSIASRITDKQKAALYAREITTRDLAKLLRVRESSLSHLFPGKTPIEPNNKPELIAIRKTFRHLQALAVLEKRLSIKEAADIVNLSYRSMARVVQTVRNSTPKPATQPLFTLGNMP